MAKGGRGGQRAGGALSGQQQLNNYIANGGRFPNAMARQLGVTQPQQPQQQPQVDTTTQPSAMSVDYNKFMAMTDDEKADVITNSISQGVPSHLSQTDFQKFIYNSGLNDKPDIVDEATLNAMTGQELFRTVNAVYDKKNDISYNADQIAKQVQAGRVTRTSDNGGSVYGRGIYFATTYGSSASSYGRTSGNIKQTAIMRAKFNSNAKIINYNQAHSGYNKEISSGSKLGKALAKCDTKSGISIYAMAKGYNVISDGYNDYMNVLNRGALTMSSTVKAKSTKW